MAETTRKDVGEATAYAYAVAGGYVGTKEEFEEALANASITVQELENLSAVAVTLAPSSEATASYENGVLTFGIPQGAKGDKGDKGDKGNKGDTGNGIASIAKTDTIGLVDTYTITFTDGTTTTFTVTNGADGDITNVAQAFSTSKAYAVGDMVLYQGTLYAFTAAHSAGAWIGTDAQAVILTDVVTDLKSDLSAELNLLGEGKKWIDGTWKVGTIIRATGAYYQGSYYYRICTPDFVTFNASTKYTIASGFVLQVYVFNSDGNLTAAPIDYTGSYTAPSNTKLKFVIMRSTEDTSEHADIIQFRSKIYLLVDTKKELDTLYSTVSDMDDAYDKYLKLVEANISFSGHTEGSTYQAEWFDCIIPVGETVLIKIVCPTNDVNTSYINFNDANNNRLNPSALYAGTSTRIVSFTNNYSSAVAKIGLTLIKVNAQNSYVVDVYKATFLPFRVDALENEIESINNVVGAEPVPGYFETQLSTAIGSAQSNMLAAGIDGETFVFISDIHWENNQKHSPTLIREITRNLNIENVVFGGDAINGGTQAAEIANMNEIRQKFELASKRFLAIFGNHDSNSQDGGVTFTHKEFYTLLQKQFDYDVNYIYPYFFYMDNPSTKTRWIFLDTGMTNPNNPTAEMNWLQSAVSGTPSEWHILVFAHVIYVPSGGDYSDPSTFELTSFMTDVCTYLDSINEAGQKKVEAIFGGHCHIDYDNVTTGGIPIIMIDTDSSQTNSASGYTVGTTTEQCFDIITINYTAEKINCTRVGRGQDREFTY